MPSQDPAREASLLAAQKESLELIVSGAPLEVVLRQIVLSAEASAGGTTVASIMLVDDQGRLRSAAAPSLPEDYLAAIDGIRADPNLGTCAAAAALGEIVVTPDFESAPGWKGLSHLPLALGLVGAWSRPIISRDGRVLGTFGTYFRERRRPTERERAVVEVLVRTAALAIERDAAERERVARGEELRRAKDAAEAASHAKSQFLAVMSHELRTPLTGIIGYADLLASEIDGPLSATQVVQAKRIKSGAWHLVSIIDEILTFSRTEAGRETVVRELVDLAQIVRDSAALLQPEATARGIEFSVRAEPSIPLMTDPGKVRQIMLNLAGNALKFTDHGSVEIAVERTTGEVVVQVRDSGRGIPAAKLEEIFEPFSQVEQNHTRTVGGTGLGLTVSRRLARLLGGDLNVVDSRVDAGSTFVFRLPA